ncbi:MAG: hypothetical protein KGL29_14100, partial [Alphaproteobacteria bacterium]|nr:hypothetical protein [Alphaproteobacteria bacterium]
MALKREFYGLQNLTIENNGLCDMTMRALPPCSGRGAPAGKKAGAPNQQAGDQLPVGKAAYRPACGAGFDPGLV